MNEPLFIKLTCPSCGGSLLGGKTAVVFLCLSCKRAYVMKDFPAGIPLAVFKPNFKREGKLFYVPFYRIEGKLTVFTEDAKKMKAYHNLKPLGPLFYPAFFNLRTLYTDNLTLQYSLNEGKLEESEIPEKIHFIDAGTDSGNLDKVAKYFWLSHFDKAADVTDVEAQFDLISVKFALIPFEKTGEGLRELILGIPLKGFAALEPNE